MTDLSRLIGELSNPAAYPFAVERVDVRQTHISVVFLAGEFAYKIRKPVRLSFLDFSTLELRRQDCENEVCLNRRLAPQVYLGVVPVSSEGGRCRFEDPGEPREWAVKMQRLPESATLEQRLIRGEVDSERVTKLAVRIARFHAMAQRSEHIASFGRFDVVARNIRENFEVARPMVGKTVSQTVYDRLRILTDRALDEFRPLIEARAARGVPCDTHGDLHLDHVYLFPDCAAPDDLVVIDCIEFNERFRYTDPVADMAFLAMDLKFHDRRDLADCFSRAYFDSAGDWEGSRLLPLYTSYRAAVRGKVDGLQSAETEIPEEKRSKALVSARAHWCQAWRELEEPSRWPCLILTGGLPGSGKSTLARHLADRHGFAVVRSDVVRKELAGLDPQARATDVFGGGIYSQEWTERTYAECLKRAESMLFDGRRVIVDAMFSRESHRRSAAEAARRWCVPSLLFVCETNPETVKARLAARRGDASDADWAVYLQASAGWEPFGADTSRMAHPILTDGPADEAVVTAERGLKAEGLLSA